MKRIKPDLNRDWNGHPMLSRVKKELVKRKPEDLLRLLFDVTEDHKALKDYCSKNGIPEKSVSHYWHKGKHFSIFSKTKPTDYLELRDTIIEEMQGYEPQYIKYEHEEIKDGHLLVIDPADVHIGKLATEFETGDKYNVEIAIKRVLEGVEGIIKKASGFPIEKILFIGGNDILHTDSPKRTTTAGTPQDTSGMWYDNFLAGKDLYISVLERLMSIADVKFLFCPSNHDFMSGFFLSDVIATWFRSCENISFDVDMRHRKYYKYHENLIGATHGDGAKNQDLPLLMATESDQWTKCNRRYIYTHHVHHKQSKDIQGVTVESLRSPSGTDGWHDRNGYKSKKAIEGFIHHPTDGQIARLTHYF